MLTPIFVHQDLLERIKEQELSTRIVETFLSGLSNDLYNEDILRLYAVYITIGEHWYIYSFIYC